MSGRSLMCNSALDFGASRRKTKQALSDNPTPASQTMTTAFLTAAPERKPRTAPLLIADESLQRFAYDTCADIVELVHLSDAAFGLVSTGGRELQVLADWGDAGLGHSFTHGPGSQVVRAAADSLAVAESADRTLVAAAAPAGELSVVILGRRGSSRGTCDPSQALVGMVRVAANSLCDRRRLIDGERRRSAQQHARLTCSLHDEVVQRLFGVSLILDAQDSLKAPLTAICATEIERALADLRLIISSPVGQETAGVAMRGDELRTTLEEIREQGTEVDADLDDVTIAPTQQAIACSVMSEALRNARKHAEPERVQVTARQDGEVLLVSVFNDGVRAEGSGRHARRGVGLQLAATEAALGGGVLESGPAGPHGWTVRLALPLEERDDYYDCAGSGTGGGAGG